MKDLVEILNESILSEGNIDDLKNVRYIHHYTTLEGLAKILDDGYIKAHESIGDSDWDGYDIGEEKVVSFHDARTDSELNFLTYANDRNYILTDTHTLGIHMEKICAMIEYNFDILPNKIKEHANIIKILEHYVPEFCSLWNELCEIKAIIPTTGKNKVKDYKSLLAYLEENDYPNIYNRIEDSLWYFDDQKDAFVKMLMRKNLKPYSNSDEDALLKAAIEDDKKKVFNILKQHGWKNNDEYNQFIYHYGEWENHTFLEYLRKRFLDDNSPINIEIRIACDIPINIRGCTIYFFKGTADWIKNNIGFRGDYDEFIKVLEQTPNVEIYKPKDDYSLIN